MTPAYSRVVTAQGTAVEPAHPPAAMLRVTNPVVRLLLRSPVGGPMRRQFMVLRFYGRKTGQRCYIPVVVHRLGEELYSLTDARWRHNFRDGADAEVTLDGHVTRMRGQLLEDPAVVAPIYARFGVKRAQRMLGLKIHTLGTPSAEALAEAARRYRLGAIRLTVKTLTGARSRRYVRSASPPMLKAMAYRTINLQERLINPHRRPDLRVALCRACSGHG